MATIYILEDDLNIQEIEAYALKNSGYQTEGFDNAREFFKKVSERVPSLLLLDIMLPDADGLDVLRKLRSIPETKKLPIILVTAKTSEIDKVKGLDVGADDYITKPFNPMELVARVKSQLRRYLQLGSQTVTSSTNQDILEVNGLRINTATKQVFVDGKEVRLTPTEFKILSLLMRNKGRVFSISDIYENVWDEPGYNAENTVAVHIRKIREKIEINPRDPRYLKVVWGIGYKIEA